MRTFNFEHFESFKEQLLALPYREQCIFKALEKALLQTALTRELYEKDRPIYIDQEESAYNGKDCFYDKFVLHKRRVDEYSIKTQDVFDETPYLYQEAALAYVYARLFILDLAGIEDLQKYYKRVFSGLIKCTKSISKQFES